MSDFLYIRPAHLEDVLFLSGILAEFGHDVPKTALEEHLISAPDKITYVAVMGEEPVGLIEARVGGMLHLKDQLARITTLFVGTKNRRKGIGRALVGAVMAWAADKRCGGLELTAPLRASDAHGFYESLGFNISALRFSRCLRGGV